MLGQFIRTVLAGVALAILVATPSQSATITNTRDLGIDPGVVFPLFNPVLGDLNSVSISYTGSGSARAEISGGDVIVIGPTPPPIIFILSASLTPSSDVGPLSTVSFGTAVTSTLASKILGQTTQTDLNFSFNNTILLDAAAAVLPFVLTGGGPDSFASILNLNASGLSVTGASGIEKTVLAPFAVLGEMTVIYNFTPVSSVPVPAALPLLLTGLAGLGLAARRRSKTR